jgi:integrase
MEKARCHGSALAFHLANALFQTACRFDELIQLTWSDCQAVGKEIVALRIKGKGSVFQDVPVTGALSAALLEWKEIQEGFNPFDPGRPRITERLRPVLDLIATLVAPRTVRLDWTSAARCCGERAAYTVVATRFPGSARDLRMGSFSGRLAS